MDLITLSTIFITAYFALLLFITYRNRKIKNSEDYSIANRKVGVLPTAASISAGFRDGAALTVWITLSILYGVYTLFFILGTVLALLIVYFRIGKIKSDIDKNNPINLSDLIFSKIGRKTAFLGTIIFAITSFLYATSQMSIVGELFNSLFNVSNFSGIAIAGLIVGIYLFIGGYKTVIKTDYFQWLFLIIIFIIPFSFQQVNFSTLNWFGIMDPDWRLLIAVSFLSLVVPYSNYADLWQRLISTKSEKVAKQSLLIAVLAYGLIGTSLTFIGIIASQFVSLDQGNVFFSILHSGMLSPIFAALLGVVLISAMMSTLDTHVFSFSQLISKNMLKNKKENNVKYTRIISSIFIISIIILASTVNDLISFFFSASSLISIFAPVMLFYSFNLFQKRKNLDKEVSVILIIATILYLAMFSVGYFSDTMKVLLPALVSLILITIVELYYFLKKRVSKNEIHP